MLDEARLAMRYAEPRYTAGVMLGVERPAAGDWQGDPSSATVTTHEIGPCDSKVLTNTEDTADGEQRVLLIQITAPRGADVLPGDIIIHPDHGRLVIDGSITLVPNGFTGWAAGKRFRIAKDGAHGIRR